MTAKRSTVKPDPSAAPGPPTLAKILDSAHAAGDTEVSAAQRELDDAEQLLAALEECVRAGDPGVAPSELREAKDLVAYARLRVQAAERRAAELVVEARHAQYREVGADARALCAVADAPIVAAFAAALAALGRLWDAAAARSAQLGDVMGRAATLVVEANQADERVLLRAAGVHNASATGVSIVPAEGPPRQLVDVRPDQLAAAVLRRLLTDQAAAQGQAAKRAGRPFYGPPWAGEVLPALDAAGSVAAVAEFPKLATVEPTPPGAAGQPGAEPA